MQQLADVLAKPGFQKAAANLGWLLAERGVRFVLGVMVGFVVARHLGPVQLGSLSYSVAITTLIGGVVALGLDAVVKRELLQSPDRTGTILASSGVLRLGVAAIAGLVLLVVVRGGLAGGENRLLAILALTLFQPAWLVADLWLQVHLQAKVSALAQTGALAVGAALRLLLVSRNAPLEAFAWVVSGEALLTAVGIQLLSRRAGLRFAWSAARLATMRQLLALAWPLMFSGLAIILYIKIDEVMLRHMAGAGAVGIYAAATRFTEIWYFIPLALASSLLPALLRARERGAAEYRARLQHYYDLNAGVAYVLAVPIALAAPWIVRIAYGAEFAASAPIIAVHVWSSVFVFIGVARGQWLINERLQYFYLAATLLGAVTNIGLNFCLIPRWGGLGAAVATVISQALAGWVSSFCLAATRESGWMQLRALLVPLLGFRYLRRG